MSRMLGYVNQSNNESYEKSKKKYSLSWKFIWVLCNKILFIS
jgi:hypothetical protein